MDDCATIVVRRRSLSIERPGRAAAPGSAAVDSMTTGLEQLHTEVFRGPCLDEVVERGDRFFSVMPSVRVVLEADDEQIPTEPRAG